MKKFLFTVTFFAFFITGNNQDKKNTFSLKNSIYFVFPFYHLEGSPVMYITNAEIEKMYILVKIFFNTSSIPTGSPESFVKYIIRLYQEKQVIITYDAAFQQYQLAKNNPMFKSIMKNNDISEIVLFVFLFMFLHYNACKSTNAEGSKIDLVKIKKKILKENFKSINRRVILFRKKDISREEFLIKFEEIKKKGDCDECYNSIFLFTEDEIETLKNKKDICYIERKDEYILVLKSNENDASLEERINNFNQNLSN